MFKLSKKADYALIIITHLADHPDQYTSVRHISDETKVPYKFASQIATELKKSRLITSKEGIDGGYQLALTPDEITFKDVVESIEGPVAPTSCLKGKECNCRDSCYHYTAINSLSQSLADLMSKHTIASLMKDGKRA